MLGQGGGETISTEFFSGYQGGKAQSFDSCVTSFHKAGTSQLRSSRSFRGNVSLGWSPSSNEESLWKKKWDHARHHHWGACSPGPWQSKLPALGRVLWSSVCFVLVCFISSHKQSKPCIYGISSLCFCTDLEYHYLYYFFLQSEAVVFFFLTLCK